MLLHKKYKDNSKIRRKTRCCGIRNAQKWRKSESILLSWCFETSQKFSEFPPCYKIFYVEKKNIGNKKWKWEFIDVTNKSYPSTPKVFKYLQRALVPLYIVTLWWKCRQIYNDYDDYDDDNDETMMMMRMSVCCREFPVQL